MKQTISLQHEYIVSQLHIHIANKSTEGAVYHNLTAS